MSDLMLDVGLANELKMAFRRNGWTEEQIKKAASGDFLAKVRRVLIGDAVIAFKKTVDTNAPPWIPQGLFVAYHQTTGPRNTGLLEWNPLRVVLWVAEGQKGDKGISGYQLYQEITQKVTSLNANVLDYLLEHPQLIPEEWKDKDVFFWGTIYRNIRGNQFVRCLHWGGRRWISLAYSFTSDWDEFACAAVLAS